MKVAYEATLTFGRVRVPKNARCFHRLGMHREELD